MGSMTTNLSVAYTTHRTSIKAVTQERKTKYNANIRTVWLKTLSNHVFPENIFFRPMNMKRFAQNPQHEKRRNMVKTLAHDACVRD